MPESPAESPGLDPTVPNVARMYDYMLGGKENYASDRAAVARLIEMAPAVPAFARHNRAFLRGFSLVEPGLVHISQWRPPVPVPQEFDGFLAAVGRKD
jgi:S-adenosyl methyltransferase